MKGICLAGGLGTRMSPITNVTNKHLLPIYSNNEAVPMIHYPINTLVNSGVNYPDPKEVWVGLPTQTFYESRGFLAADG